MSKREYVWAFDTNNRDKSVDQGENPTNNVLLNLDLSLAKVFANAMTLTGVEIPMTQYTIEKQFNTVYFNESGLRFANVAPSNLFIEVTNTIRNRQTLKSTGVQKVRLSLPPMLNPIVSMDTTTHPDGPIFITTYKHHLFLRHLWTWGDIKLLGFQDTTCNNIRIIDEYTFQWISNGGTNGGTNGTNFDLSLSNPVFEGQLITKEQIQINGNGLGICLYFPPFPNYKVLASVLTAACTNAMTFSFNESTGRFSCVNNYGLSYSTPTTLTNASMGVSELAATLGFGSTAVWFPDNMILEASSYPSELKRIQIIPGNYDETSLLRQIKQQLNRFTIPDSTSTLVFTDTAYSERSISFVPGIYTAETLCQYLGQQMTIADTHQSTYSVALNSQKDKFVFSNQDGREFALLWSKSSPFLSCLFGFANGVDCQGQSVYYSLQTNQVFGTQCNVYDFGTDPLTGKLRIVCKKTPSLWMNMEYINTTNNVLLTNSRQAHGFQPGQIIRIGYGNHLLKVSQVVNAFQLLAESTSLDLESAVTVRVSKAEPFAIVNWLFCNLPDSMNALPRDLLGFESRVYQKSVDDIDGCFVGTCKMNLAHPSYLLVRVDHPQGYSNLQHNWEGHNMPNLFGKVVVGCSIRMDRLQMPIYNLQQGRIVNSVRLTLLNPDHTEYQLHGRNWSGAITFHILES